MLTAVSDGVFVDGSTFETAVDESILQMNPNAVYTFVEYLADSLVVANVSHGSGFLGHDVMCLKVFCDEVEFEWLFEDEVAEAIHQVVSADDVQVTIVAFDKSADTERVNRADEIEVFVEGLEHVTTRWVDVIGDETETCIELV